MKFNRTEANLLALASILLLASFVLAVGWKTDYVELTSGNIADGDAALVLDISDTTMAATGTQKYYLWSSLKTDLSSFDAFEFPNANDTTTLADVQAEAAHDNNNYSLNIHDGTNLRVYASRTKCLPPVVIAEPDQVQAISDTWPLYRFPAEQFPGGFVIEAIQVTTSATCTDVLDFREYNQNGTTWTNASQIESITLSGVFTEDDGTLADGTIAADAEIWINMDDATDNIAWLAIQVCGQIPVNN